MALDALDRERLGNLYFVSKTFDIGSFELSAHLDNPDLPPSPYYMHFPAPNKPGALYLPEIQATAGRLLFQLAEEEGITGHMFAGVPEGANEIARNAAELCGPNGSNLLTFSKEKLGRLVIFHHIEGHAMPGEKVIGIDDHTSGGRNARLFQRMLETEMRLKMTHFLNIVDREQGGRQRLAENGATMRSIFTISELLGLGLAEGHLTQTQFDDLLHYVRTNPIPTQH